MSLCWLLAAKPLSSGVWGGLGGSVSSPMELQQGQLRTHGAVAEISLARSAARVSGGESCKETAWP